MKWPVFLQNASGNPTLKSPQKHWAPRRHYTQAAPMESVNLSCSVGVARGPVWRGAQLEEIGQIGLKPALVPVRLR